MEAHGRPEGRPMAEIRAIVAADNARFDELAEVWGELTEAEQVELVALAKAKARVEVEGLMEGSIARSAITRVTCDTHRIVVEFGVRGHDDLIRVSTDWDIDTLDVSPDVEIRWSGTSEHGIEFARAFKWALEEAVRVAGHITYVLRERKFDLISGDVYNPVQPDYTLLAYLLVHGEKVAYTRGRELTGDESPRVADLAGLHARVREIADNKEEKV